MWRNRSPYRQPFPETADAVFAAGDVPPAVMVYVDAWTAYGGGKAVRHLRDYDGDINAWWSDFQSRTAFTKLADGELLELLGIIA